MRRFPLIVFSWEAMMPRQDPPRFIRNGITQEEEGQLSLWIYREMFVFQMFRDAFGLFHLAQFGRGVNLVVRCAACRGAAHVSNSVSERNARSGHTDKFDGLVRCSCQQQRSRIGQANAV